MLIGTYQHNLDAKGRLFIPAKLREDLGDVFVVTRGTSGCLFGMSKNQWESFALQLAARPLGDHASQMVVRQIASMAGEVELDKQGRVLLPAPLRKKAGLGREIVIIGAVNRVEIWDKERWEAYLESSDIEYDEAIDQARL